MLEEKAACARRKSLRKLDSKSEASMYRLAAKTEK